MPLAGAGTALAVLALLVGIREETHGARTLDRPSELGLLTPRETGDATGADLSTLGQEATERREVLPVDLLGRELRPALARCRRRRTLAALTWILLLPTHTLLEFETGRG